MSATDIAKEVVRIANTHGLAKDVIDLLEKKLALLVEENALLSSKVSRLEIENGQLRAQLQDSQPVGDKLPEQAVQILKLFFDSGRDLSIEQVSAHLRIQKGMVEHYFDTLMERDFLRQTTVGFGDHSGNFGLLPKGRAYVAKTVG